MLADALQAQLQQLFSFSEFVEETKWAHVDIAGPAFW